VTDKNSNWPAKAMSAVVLLLMISIGARITYELLAPLTPYLTVVIMLAFIYYIALGRGR
jgi:hypothetical protein